MCEPATAVRLHRSDGKTEESCGLFLGLVTEITEYDDLALPAWQRRHGGVQVEAVDGGVHLVALLRLLLFASRGSGLAAEHVQGEVAGDTDTPRLGVVGDRAPPTERACAGLRSDVLRLRPVSEQ